MATTLYADPMRVPFVDPRTGKLTREGFLYLNGLRADADALSGADALASLAALAPLRTDSDATVAPDPGPEGRIAALEAELDDLRRTVANLLQGYQL